MFACLLHVESHSPTPVQSSSPTTCKGPVSLIGAWTERMRRWRHQAIRADGPAAPSPFHAIADPEGGGQDVRRFSTRQEASPKNPGHASDGRCAVDLNVFFGDFLCAKESRTRASAEKDSGHCRRRMVRPRTAATARRGGNDAAWSEPKQPLACGGTTGTPLSAVETTGFNATGCGRIDATTPRATRAQASASSNTNDAPPPERSSYHRSPPMVRARCFASARPSPVALSPPVGCDDSRT